MAQQTQERVRSRGQVNVGYRADAAPFSMHDAAGNPVGYALELCQPMVARLQQAAGGPAVRVKYVEVPVDQVVRMVKSGAVDLLCSATSDSAERRKDIAFSPPIFITGVRLLVKAKDKLGAADQLRGKSVVAIGRTTAEKAVADGAPQHGWTAAKALDPEAAINQLDMGWAAAYARDEVLLAMQLVGNAKAQDYTLLPEVLSVETIALAFQKDDAQMQQLVDAALKDAVRSGAAAAAYQRWFQGPLPPAHKALNLPMSAALKVAFDKLR
jgi:glutamate/aspartate transport system substrate-binding protein